MSEKYKRSCKQMNCNYWHDGICKRDSGNGEFVHYCKLYDYDMYERCESKLHKKVIKVSSGVTLN